MQPNVRPGIGAPSRFRLLSCSNLVPLLDRLQLIVDEADSRKRQLQEQVNEARPITQPRTEIACHTLMSAEEIVKVH